jgi:hypothetical protein
LYASPSQVIAYLFSSVGDRPFVVSILDAEDELAACSFRYEVIE